MIRQFVRPVSLLGMLYVCFNFLILAVSTMSGQKPQITPEIEWTVAPLSLSAQHGMGSPATAVILAVLLMLCVVIHGKPDVR
jgi:hypothetical protein